MGVDCKYSRLGLRAAMAVAANPAASLAKIRRAAPNRNIPPMTKHAAGAKVNRVVLEIGKLSAVLPDAVRFCFELCSEGTVVEGAELEIIETPVSPAGSGTAGSGRRRSR